MGCFVAVIALLVPRAAIVQAFLLTDWFERVYDTWVWPVLGFIFLPYTTLAYLGGTLNADGSMSFWWKALIVLAVIADLGHLGGGSRMRRGRIVFRRR